MRTLLIILFVGWLVVTASRWAFVSIDDGTLFSEIANTPISMADSEYRASSIASIIAARCEQAKCAPIIDGIEVDVKAPVAEGRGANIKMSQEILTHVQCRRRNALFLMKTLDMKTRVVLPVGSGFANRWPENPQ